MGRKGSGLISLSVGAGIGNRPRSVLISGGVRSREAANSFAAFSPSHPTSPSVLTGTRISRQPKSEASGYALQNSGEGLGGLDAAANERHMSVNSNPRLPSYRICRPRCVFMSASGPFLFIRLVLPSRQLDFFGSGLSDRIATSWR